MHTEQPPTFDLKSEPRAVEPVDVRPQFLAPPPPVGAKRWAVRVALLFLMLCATAVLGHYGVMLRDGLYDRFPKLRHEGDIRNAFNQGYRVNEIARELELEDIAAERVAVEKANRESGTQVPVPNRQVSTRPSASYVKRAMVKRFDDAYDEAGQSHLYDFDYAPLRLLVTTLWVRELRTDEPAVSEWRNGFVFVRPLLKFNTVMAGLTAVGMFLLVRHWVLRHGRTPGPSPIRRVRAWMRNRKGASDPAADSTTSSSSLPSPGSIPPAPTIRAWVLAWVAAMLVWYEPNILVESHIWPQWDLWIVPFFVLAAWLTSANWWFTAGLALGIGVMFKGQLLFAAPLFVLWPIFDARPGNLARVLTGFGTGFLGVAAPWLLQTKEAGGVVLLALGACAATAPYFWMKRSTWVYGAVTACVVLGMLAPFLFKRDLLAVGWGLALVALVVAGPWVVRREFIGVWAMAVVCVALVASAVHWGGSWSWWAIGFGYGTRRYEVFYMGRSVSNLATLLTDVYRWDMTDLYAEVFTTDIPKWLAAHVRERSEDRARLYLTADDRLIVSPKMLMTAIYVVAVVLCAWAAARHARRNDKRFLIAVVAPWVIFFAVMPQMHERYLFWGAIVTVAGVGVSLGAGLLWAVVSGFSVGMILLCQMPGNAQAYLDYTPAREETLWNLRAFLKSARPVGASLMLILACVYLFLALTSSPRTSSTPAGRKIRGD